MVLCDVNVLVYAFRKDTDRHEGVRRWLEETINSPTTFGMSDLAASGFLRIVTHPGIFKNPDVIEKAFPFLDGILSRPNCTVLRPGTRHWEVFRDLCRKTKAKGNIVPDAFFAALAIEHGCEWVTTDRDYSRFTGLKVTFL